MSQVKAQVAPSPHHVCGRHAGGKVAPASSVSSPSHGCAHCADSFAVTVVRRSTVSRSIANSVGDCRSRPIPSTPGRPDLDSWRNCGGRFAAPSAPIARRSAERAIRANDRAPTRVGPVGWLSGEEDSHPTRSPQAVRSQETTPSGDSTEVPVRQERLDRRHDISGGRLRRLTGAAVFALSDEELGPGIHLGVLLEQRTPLALSHAAPDTELHPVVQRVRAAFRDDGTVSADRSRFLLCGSANEEFVGIGEATPCLRHPPEAGFGRRNDGLRHLELLPCDRRRTETGEKPPRSASGHWPVEGS